MERNSLLFISLLAGLAALKTQQPAPPPAGQAPSGPAATQTSQPPPTATAPVRPSLVIVLDPAHGGTDNGARGSAGTVEKNIVLELAKYARAEFERQGFHVIQTRQGDENPSYDDRAAVANAHRDAIYISLHVSSTGKMATARAYAYQFWSPFPGTAPNSGASATSSQSRGLLPWEEAQRPFADASKRLADMIETELAKSFPGSPSTSSLAEVRSLRSVAAPAVAVEVSSVSNGNEQSLEALGPPLAGALVRGVNSYGQSSATRGPSGGK